VLSAGLLSRCAEDGAAGDAVGGDEALLGGGIVVARGRGLQLRLLMSFGWLPLLLGFRRGG